MALLLASPGSAAVTHLSVNSTGCGVGTSCNSLHVIRNYSDIVVVADIIIYYPVFENV
jgi:hypothetical protein